MKISFTTFALLLLILMEANTQNLRGVWAEKNAMQLLSQQGQKNTNHETGWVGLNHSGLQFGSLKTADDSDPAKKENYIVDDILQYAPVFTVYGLNLVGINGKHNFRDRTLIIAGSYVLMASMVYGLKTITNVERPDGSSFDSFPSGHTAIAFMGAEFLRQEYKHKSVWYGVAGYSLATATAGFRLYNKRHWWTDVAAGAAIGVLSTQFAYWVYPYVAQRLFPAKTNTDQVSATFYPFSGQHGAGVGLTICF